MQTLWEKWDLIFFTGSPQVGKIIHPAAANRGRDDHPDPVRGVGRRHHGA